MLLLQRLACSSDTENTICFSFALERCAHGQLRLHLRDAHITRQLMYVPVVPLFLKLKCYFLCFAISPAIMEKHLQ